LNHYATPEFWGAYRALPVEVQALANKSFELLKSDSRHPSLHFKRVGEFYSVRVGLTTELWGSPLRMACHGSGLELTPLTIGSLANPALERTPNGDASLSPFTVAQLAR
jgi:hypothetical protein